MNDDDKHGEDMSREQAAKRLALKYHCGITEAEEMLSKPEDEQPLEDAKP